MLGWRKVRRASIPAELRRRFELFGEDVLVHAIGAGEHSSKGPELDRLLRENRAEILEWLQEQADARKLREEQTSRYVRWTFWAAVAAVIVGIIGVAVTWFGH
jgi:hypothetical protein